VRPLHDRRRLRSCCANTSSRRWDHVRTPTTGTACRGSSRRSSTGSSASRRLRARLGLLVQGLITSAWRCSRRPRRTYPRATLALVHELRSTPSTCTVTSSASSSAASGTSGGRRAGPARPLGAARELGRTLSSAPSPTYRLDTVRPGSTWRRWRAVTAPLTAGRPPAKDRAPLHAPAVCGRAVAGRRNIHRTDASTLSDRSRNGRRDRRRRHTTSAMRS
jgi:hypothetical protein